MTIKINGRELPREAVEFELQRLVKFYTAHMPPQEVQKQMHLLKHKAAEQAIGARLLMDEAARLDIKVKPSEIDDRVAQMTKQAGGKAKFRELLRKQNLTEERLRTSIEQGRKVDLLVEKVVTTATDPDEADIQRHYEEHKAEYTRPAQAEVQHILMKPASDTKADRSTTRSRLLSIRQDLQSGVDFAGQAAAHSECPSGKKTGGSLGWVSRGTMVPEFEKAVFELEIGQISDVVETPLGMHLLRKTAQEDEQPAPYAEVHDRIRDFLRHSKRGELIAAFVKELREKAVIEGD